MTTDMELAARQAGAFLAGQRRAEEVASLLRDMLAELGVTVGDETGWPRLVPWASASGAPRVYLGSVPLATADTLAEALMCACLRARKREQRQARVARSVGSSPSPPSLPARQTGEIAMAATDGDDHKGPPAPLEPLPLPEPHPDGGPPPGDGGHRR